MGTVPNLDLGVFGIVRPSPSDPSLHLLAAVLISPRPRFRYQIRRAKATGLNLRLLFQIRHGFRKFLNRCFDRFGFSFSFGICICLPLQGCSCCIRLIDPNFGFSLASGL
ncbi:hypothetical protein SDJN02_22922, partial [Cucurbita argyrosperma subsp. argyrosperma]